jgi:signal peptidase II
VIDGDASGATRATRRPGASVATAHVELLGLAACVVALDQATKAVADATMRTHPIELLGGGILLIYTRNTGAAFSFFQSGGLIFALVALVVSAGIILYYRRVAAGSLLLRVGLALVLGGAVGNLIDRIRLGYVVEFIDLRWWPVFNAADSAVVIGVATLVLQSFLAGQSQGE